MNKVLVEVTHHKLSETEYEPLDIMSIPYSSKMSVRACIQQDLTDYLPEIMESLELAVTMKDSEIFVSVFEVQFEYHKDYLGDVDASYSAALFCHSKVGVLGEGTEIIYSLDSEEESTDKSFRLSLDLL